MPPGYETRYKVEIKSFSKYPDEARWNFRLVVYDNQHPVYSFDDPVHEFDVDFTGDKAELRDKVHKKLQALANDSTLYKIKEVQEVLSEFNLKDDNHGTKLHP